MLQDSFLVQHVNASTGGGIALDLIISSDSNMTEDVNIVEHFALSDIIARGSRRVVNETYEAETETIPRRWSDETKT